MAQQQPGKQEQALRSVFVGNIPYDATEEKLRDIFSTVGPVLGFRLVYDRDTGKPKGYGFCEYKDQETAASAIRNLNGHDFNGRQLRVDSASNERAQAEEFKTSLQSSAGVTNLGSTQVVGGLQGASSYYGGVGHHGHSMVVDGQPGVGARPSSGVEVEPDKAPETINKVMASLAPEQMFELAKQIKQTIQTNPNEARNMLIQNPQLCYALLQSLVSMRAIDPQIAMNILHRPMGQQIPVASFAQAGTIMGPPPQPMGPISMGILPHAAVMHPQQMGRPMQGPLLGPAAPYAVQPSPFGGIGDASPPTAISTVVNSTQISSVVNPTMLTGPTPVPQVPQVPPQTTAAQHQPQPNPRDPRLNRARPSAGNGPSPTSVAQQSSVQSEMSEQEKQSLIYKVLQLSDHEISLLPPEQQQKVIMLKEQFNGQRVNEN